MLQVWMLWDERTPSLMWGSRWRRQSSLSTSVFSPHSHLTSRQCSLLVWQRLLRMWSLSMVLNQAWSQVWWWINQSWEIESIDQSEFSIQFNWPIRAQYSILLTNHIPGLLDYAYTGQITITKHNVQSMLSAANLLEILPVRDACCQFLDRWDLLILLESIETDSQEHGRVQLSWHPLLCWDSLLQRSDEQS